MSLRENLKSVKEEIGAQEQFIESIIKSERFYKKYKRYIILGAIAVVLLAIGYTASNIIKSRDIRISNEAYVTLTDSPKNVEALKVLKDKNPKLYSLFLFQEALKNKDVPTLEKLAQMKKSIFLSDLATYELAQIKNQKVAKSDLLNGFVLLENGFNLLKQGKQREAELKFAQINPNSSLAGIVKNLEHYKVKSK